MTATCGRREPVVWGMHAHTLHVVRQGSPSHLGLVGPPPRCQDARGFCALAFSPSGTRLVAVTMDNYHSVYVYDWRKKREIFSGRGTMGDPPQVRGTFRLCWKILVSK